MLALPVGHRSFLASTFLAWSHRNEIVFTSPQQRLGRSVRWRPKVNSSKCSPWAAPAAGTRVNPAVEQAWRSKVVPNSRSSSLPRVAMCASRQTLRREPCALGGWLIVRVYVELSRFAATATRAELRDMVHALEDAGATGVSFSDHIFVPENERRRAESVAHNCEPLTAMAAVVGMSDHLAVQTTVVNTAWIHPALLLRQFAQLAVLAGGQQVTAGLGAGWSAEEFDALGMRMPSFRQRMDRFEEVVAFARSLFSDRLASITGLHVTARQVALSPPCAIPPHLLSGEPGESAEVLVERHEACGLDRISLTENTGVPAAPHDPIRFCQEVVPRLPRLGRHNRLRPSQMSRTRRGVQERETQIIMQLPASRSSWSRTESRWSGIPSSTDVSHVPQVPSAQEDSTPTPASSTTERMDLSGRTVRVSSLCAR